MTTKELYDANLQFFTVQDIAKMLQLSSHTITNYIKEGKLEATKVGKGWRITQDDLKAFLEN